VKVICGGLGQANDRLLIFLQVLGALSPARGEAEQNLKNRSAAHVFVGVIRFSPPPWNLTLYPFCTAPATALKENIILVAVATKPMASPDGHRDPRLARLWAGL